MLFGKTTSAAGTALKRGLLGLCLPALLSVGLASASAATGAEPPRPNVVLVMTDDQGYGELACHGNPVVRTPNLDRLHGESVRLTDFHVAPMCTPTRGQLMTGVDALRNGAMNVSSGRTLLRPEIPTMADFFSSAGYRTGIFGKWHLGDNYPFRPQDRGFEHSLWFPSSHIGSVPDFWNNDYFDDTFIENGRRKQFPGYSTDVFFSEAIRWMKSAAKSGAPFFAYIPPNAAHSPHFVPDRYRGPVAQSLEKAAPSLPKLAPAQRRELVSYLAMVENIDENLGRLESFLQAEGLRDNTILIFLTDNGSTMGPRYFNAGMKGGKVTLWEGGHRVPCFIRWPAGGLTGARDVSELTEVQDLLPTLVELCRLPADGARFDGVSLAGLVSGRQPALPDRMLVINYSRMPTAALKPGQANPAVPRREGAAVLWKRWRLLEDQALYDLDSDPLQEKNVIEDFPEVAAKMRRRLDAWWNGLQDQVNTPQRVVVGSEKEDPTMLTACEWLDVFVDQQRQVRRGERKSGAWRLQVARAGQYEFELRRWPREADRALTAGMPETPVADGRYEAGAALPIRSAALRIGGQRQSRAVAETEKAAIFRLGLDAGPTTLQTWFYDENEQEICGAYYVYVRRLGDKAHAD